MIKNIKSFILLVIGSTILFSCAPTKNAAYFKRNNHIANINTPDNVYSIEIDTTRKIQIGDELYVSVTSGNDEPNNFNQSAAEATIALELLTYKVDNEGFIRLPYLKRIKVEGLSVRSAIAILENKLSEYIYLPSVNVKIINNRVSVLGDVNAPGLYIHNRENTNIYEMIAMAGDIAAFGNRKNVLIIRQDGDKITKKYVDLTNDRIIYSDWFYIQSNDIIYVEPLARRSWGMETFSPFDLFGFITSSITVYLLIRTQFESE